MAKDPARAARTESLFRRVNERIAETVADGAGSFICECDDPDCTKHVDVPMTKYDEVRSKPRRFVVRPGHADEAIERVVEERRGYDVVEKDDPEAAAVADETDPR